MINGLPEKLKLLRLNHKYSQKKLASMLNVSPSLISSYETGERMPSIENLKSLAQLYHCSSDYLLGLTTQSSPTLIDVSALNAEQISAQHTLIEGLSCSNDAHLPS